MVDVVFLIPARSGSKGIVDKNLQKVGGKTLLERAIEFGLEYKDKAAEVFCSTDSVEYLDVAVNCGASSLGLRPSRLGSDSAQSVDVIEHFLQDLRLKRGLAPKVLVLLQPTSPIRDQDLLKRCIEGCFTGRANVATVFKIEEPHPFKMFISEAGGTELEIKPLMRADGWCAPRQQLPSCYALSGAIYCYWLGHKPEGERDLLPAVGIVQDYFVNIDTPVDLEMARRMFKSAK